MSELKTAVFAIMQSFNRAVPLEEELRQLAALPVDQPLACRPGKPRGAASATTDRGVCPAEAKAGAARGDPPTGEPSVSEAVK